MTSTTKPRASTPALAADGLGKAFRRGRLRRRHWALEGIDLALNGGVTALVGPNGAGKSTLIRSWVGFEKPSRGSVHVLGRDPWRDPGAARRLIGYVPQAPAFHAHMTADDWLRHASRLRPGFDEADARAQLDRARVPVKVPLATLSGGQQAQVALALAIGTRAPILLLDEPLAHLDPLSRRDFLEVVRDEARERGTTVVLSSHIISDVALVCDALVVVGAGRVLLHSRVDDILQTHSVAPSADLGPASATIGPLDRTSGEVLAMHPDGERGHGRAATLEEVVLGYLMMARESRPSPSVTHA
jgi:ABC-2 type transport system ATP-binding protein